MIFFLNFEKLGGGGAQLGDSKFYLFFKFRIYYGLKDIFESISIYIYNNNENNVKKKLLTKEVTITSMAIVLNILFCSCLRMHAKQLTLQVEYSFHYFITRGVQLTTIPLYRRKPDTLMIFTFEFR
jgi:hypothetical protein